MTRSHLLHCALALAAAAALPAQAASSAASSASEGLSTSVGSASTSIQKSSNSSSKATGVAAGRYRITDVALADDSLALDRELPLARALQFWRGDVDQAMDALDLTRLAHVPVRLLSTGQAKRATLARVAASGAMLWLLDEPLNGLDADGVERVEKLVAKHLERGGAVVVASHGPLGGNWTHLELAA